jgi:endonuclease-3
MRRRDRDVADQIRTLLDILIPFPLVPLLHTDPFTFLVAVLLSAQCTDKQVNNVTQKLFALAATPEEMARVPVEAIQEIIRPCGLSQRKAAIQKLSQEIVLRFHGHVPATLLDLESLPGVGHKTASVVLVQAFGIPEFPVDRHIFRCARRWRLSKGTTVRAVEHDIKKLFPKESWARLHLQIILYARTFCPAKKHIENRCPICRLVEEQACD